MPDQDVTRGHGPAEHAAEELFRARAARFLRRRLDPGAATGLALTVALALILAAAVGFGLVAEMVTSRTGLYRWDASAAAWGAEHATPTSTWVLGMITWLGATVTVLSVTVALGVLEWVERRRESAERRPAEAGNSRRCWDATTRRVDTSSEAYDRRRVALGQSADPWLNRRASVWQMPLSERWKIRRQPD